jgi:hypothetical protein
MFASCAAVAAFTLFAVHAQGENPQTVDAHVSMTTSANGRTTAVLGRDGEKGEPLFLFCISHDKLAAPVTVKGPAKVTFRPQPIPGLPAGVTVSGPQPVADVLGIAPQSGTPILFAAKGQTLAEPALQKATRIPVTTVQRTDWVVGKGPRRGVSVEGCVAPGG